MPEIYRVRVLSVAGNCATCRVTELYPDSGLMPSRTLCLNFLWDTVDGRTKVRRLNESGDVVAELNRDFAQSSSLGKALAGRYAYEDSRWNWSNVGRFISCVGVTDLGMGIVYYYQPDEHGWQRIPEEEQQPQATYQFTATDPQWFAHLTPGMEWDNYGYSDDLWPRICSEWLTSTVLALAQGIDEEQAFERLPILADALQDAGCDADAILDHFRDPAATHVRGCWALDLVLGKE